MLKILSWLEHNILLFWNFRFFLLIFFGHLIYGEKIYMICKLTKLILKQNFFFFFFSPFLLFRVSSKSNSSTKSQEPRTLYLWERDSDSSEYIICEILYIWAFILDYLSRFKNIPARSFIHDPIPDSPLGSNSGWTLSRMSLSMADIPGYQWLSERLPLAREVNRQLIWREAPSNVFLLP